MATAKIPISKNVVILDSGSVSSVEINIIEVVLPAI